MKKFLSILLSFLLTLSQVVVRIPGAHADTVITPFADVNFEACVRDAMEIPEDPITDEDALTLTTLICTGDSIADVTELTYFTNLTTLDLSGNGLTAIDVSANTALTVLELYYNTLTSVTLPESAALTTLSLDGNDLTAIDVSKNTGLTSLNIGNNDLTAIDVSENTALTVLGLSNNDLTSVNVSANIALTELYLNSNNLTSIDISSNTLLTNLEISSNALTSIDVSENTALADLHLANNYITDISSLVDNAGLTGAGDTVDLQVNSLNLASITDIGVLTSRGVVVSYNTYCGNIIVEPTVGETCDDGNNTNRDGCSDVCLIEEDEPVEITFTDANLEACVRDALEIPEDPITDEDALTLTELDCSSNSIVDLTGLEYFTNLTSLNLDDNQIMDISVLEGMTSLTWLDLNTNQITNIQPLVDNAGIDSGDEVNLSDNLLSEESLALIDILTARGVNVTYEEAAVCTSFTYSAWSSCSGGIQTRTILISSPEGCEGGDPILSQSCSSGGGTIITHYNKTGPSEPVNKDQNNKEENTNNKGTQEITEQIVETTDLTLTQTQVKVIKKVASEEQPTREENKIVETVQTDIKKVLNLSQPEPVIETTPQATTNENTQSTQSTEEIQQILNSVTEILSGDSDIDGDGISNAQEIRNSTNPLLNNEGTIKDIFEKAPKEGDGNSSVGRLKVASVSSNGFVLTGTTKTNTEVTVKVGGHTFKTTSDRNGHYLIPVELLDAAVNSLVSIETDVDGKASRILAKVEKDTLPAPTFELKGRNVVQIKDVTASELVKYIDESNKIKESWIKDIIKIFLSNSNRAKNPNSWISAGDPGPWVSAGDPDPWFPADKTFRIFIAGDDNSDLGTTANEIFVKGNAAPLSTIVIAYKSVIYSSVVIADKNGNFTSELPKDLTAELNKNKDLKEIQHEFIVFAVDYKTNKVSPFTKGLFKLFKQN